MDGNPMGPFKGTTSTEMNQQNDLNTSVYSITDDSNSSDWSRSTASLDFERIKAENFGNSLNYAYSVHKNDEALLADFTALLEDGEETDSRVTESKTIDLNAKNNNATMSNQKMAADDTNECETNGKCSGIEKSNGNGKSNLANSSDDDVILVWAQTTSEQVPQTLSMRIASIMSDHDYLSQEDIMEIMGKDDEQLYQEASTSSIKKDDQIDVPVNETVAKQTTEETMNKVKANEKNDSSVAETLPANDLNDINSILKKLTDRSTGEQHLDFLRELEQKAKSIRENLTKGPTENIDTNVNRTLDSNNGESMDVLPDSNHNSCNLSDTDSDVSFSRDHSEPLEYYGNTNFSSNTEQTDTSDEEITRKLRIELAKAEEFNEQIACGVRACKIELDESSKRLENERIAAVQEIGSTFQKIITEIALDLSKIAIDFKAKEVEAAIPIDMAMIGEENDKVIDKPQTEEDDKASDPEQFDDGDERVKPTDNDSPSKKLNEKSKKRWLADSSESADSYDLDESDEDYRERTKMQKTKRQRENSTELAVTLLNNDPNLGQADCPITDDEESILIKNEPLLASQHTPTDLIVGNVDTVKKNINMPSKKNCGDHSEADEVDENMEIDDEFYGFENSAECENSIFEIGIKTELMQSIENEPKLDEKSENELPAQKSATDFDSTEEHKLNDVIDRDKTPELDYCELKNSATYKNEQQQENENGSNKPTEPSTTTEKGVLEKPVSPPASESAIDSKQKESNEENEISEQMDCAEKSDAESINENDDVEMNKVTNGADEMPDLKPAYEKPEIKLDNNDGNVSISEDEASEDEILNPDENDEEDQNDKEIERLLDFSALGVKRKNPPSNYVPSKPTIAADVELKKTTKKQSKEDELLNILEKPDEKNDDSESYSKSDSEEMTEEQFLKEHNQTLKRQMLQDSSSDSDISSDDENESVDKKINGIHSDNSDYDDTDYDENAVSDTDESLVDKFLENKMHEARENESQSNNMLVDSDGEQSDSSATSKTGKTSSSITTKASIVVDEKNEKSNASTKHKDDESDKSDVDDIDSEKSNASDQPNRKSKSTVGKNVFGNLDKEFEIVLPSGGDDSENESDKKSPSDKDSKLNVKGSNANSDCEILDTSMFKTNKKEISSTELSKKLTSNRIKQSAARATPDECISLSSDEELDLEPISVEKNDAKEGNDDDDIDKEKRVTRKLLRHDQLADDTKQAQREEQDRIKRLEKKNDRLSQFVESQRSQSQKDDVENHDVENEVILDYDTKRNDKIVLHSGITKHLKSHQIDGIKFMYDCCYGSVDTLDKYPGSGCILAHCMGLGKTLQLISLLHTVISYPQLKTDKVLVICPKSTVMNWKEEIEQWLSPIKGTRRLKLYQFQEASDINTKIRILKDWSQSGKKNNSQAGCLLMGYEAFRVLVFYHRSKNGQKTYTADDLESVRKSFKEYLLEPGADLVICDEGHMIKNQKSTTSLAVNQIQTKRRIILTGTPIQNNLKEYYSMVNFIKPSFLGTEKEFANLYVNPIKNGQHKDSSKSEIKYMKQRSYVLHKKLSRFVQRREAALLKTFLPEKFEYVLFVPMTAIQNDLYEYFLENNPAKERLGGKSLIPDYTVLRKIWTHPKVLENAYNNAILKNRNRPQLINNNNNNDSDDEQPDDVLDSQTGKMSVTSDWWKSLLSNDDLHTILPSNKLKVLFEILNVCHRNGEKCLIFSAFVAVLDVVEFFMTQINNQEKSGEKLVGVENFLGPWRYGIDYYRLDGKTPKNRRHEMITNFNDPKNNTRCFLISAKAGGQGINLTGANRVILLDTSWNPSNDQQNIFRVFRLGQKKVCYIYRLLAMGTMEEKVYSRSVTKQAMSCRVVDEQQIDRHYNMAELTELYTLTKSDMADRPTPKLPQDELLAYLLHTFPRMVYKYHEHDSLLENKNDQELSEEEKADAWAAYEADVKRKNETNMGPYGNQNMGMMPNYPGFTSPPYAGMYNSFGLGSVSGLSPYQYSSLYQQMQQQSYNQYPNDNYDAAFRQSYNEIFRGMYNSSSLNYNSISPGLLSPSHSPSIASPPSTHNFSSSRNWLGSNPSGSPSPYNNNYPPNMGQSTSTSNINYNMFANLYNSTMGNGNSGGSMSVLPSGISSLATGASTSKSPPSSTTPSSYDQLRLAILQQQLLSSAALAGNSSVSSTSPLSNSLLNTPSNSTLQSQQGPNAMRNPLLSKELSIPSLLPTRNANFDALNLPSIPTSVITKSTPNTSSITSTAPVSATITSINSTIANSINSTNIEKTPSPVADNITNPTETVSKTDRTKTIPEPHIIVKNVASINNLAKQLSGASSTANTNATSKNVTGEKEKSSNDLILPNKLLDKTSTSTATQKSRFAGNMGIVYPQQRTTTNAPHAKTSADALKVATTQLHSINSKTGNKTGSELPHTELATINRQVIGLGQQKRASPTVPSSITISPRTSSNAPNIISSKAAAANPSASIIQKPYFKSSTTTSPNAASDAVNALANNKSLTVIPKRISATITAVKTQNLNSGITLSPIPSTSSSSTSIQSAAKSLDRSILKTNLDTSISTSRAAVPLNATKFMLSKGSAQVQNRSSPIPKPFVSNILTKTQQSSINTNNRSPTMMNAKPNIQVPRGTTISPSAPKTVTVLTKSHTSPSIDTISKMNNQIGATKLTASTTTTAQLPRQVVVQSKPQSPNPAQANNKRSLPPSLSRLSTSTSTTIKPTADNVRVSSINSNNASNVRTTQSSSIQGSPVSLAKTTTSTSPAVTIIPKNRLTVADVSPTISYSSIQQRKRAAEPSANKNNTNLLPPMVQIKKSKLSLSTNQPDTGVRKIGSTTVRKSPNAFQNVRVVPRHSQQTDGENSQSSQIQTMEIVELD